MRKDLFSRQKQFCRTRGWQYCLTALFLLLSVGIYAQAVGTQTFTANGTDSGNFQLTVAPADITVNDGATIQSVSIDSFVAHYFSPTGTDGCGDWYEFDLDITGGTSDGTAITGCNDEFSGIDVSNFTSITLTSQDADGESDPVYIEFTLRVTYEGVFEPIYCTPATTNVTYEFITNVNFAGIDNSTGGTVGLNDYTDQVAEVTAGDEVPISVTIDTDANDYLTVFIDWNQNGVLDDTGEVYVLAENVGDADVQTFDQSTIAVPADAAGGETRMRVILRWNAVPTPCGSYQYGEIEDYTVNVTPAGGGGCEWTVHVWDDDWYGDEVEWELRDSDGTVLISGGPYSPFDDFYEDEQSVTAEGPLTFWITNDGFYGDNEAAYEVSNENGVILSGQLPPTWTTTESSALNCDDEPIPTCSGTPDGGTAMADPTSGLNGAVSHFTVTGYSAGPLGLTYDWEYSVNGGAWLSTGVAADDVNFTITGNHGDEFAVRYVVTCTNSDETAYSNEVIYTVDNTNCTPAFSNTSDYIVNFQLEDIQNMGSGFSTGGYGDFTAMSTDLEADQTYTASLTSSSGSGTHAAGVWIDFNDNDAFELSERVGYTDAIGASQTKDITLTIPAGVSGEHKMRVLYQYNVIGVNLIPCVSATYGEAEDYMVNFGGETGGDGDLLVIDLTTENQVTITSTSNASVGTVSGPTSTGFYFENLFANAGAQTIGTTTYVGVPTLTAASVPTDNSPSLYRSGTDSGLNIWSYSATSPTTFTTGEQAFTGDVTWNISAGLYNALLTAPASGNVYFPADDATDLGAATLLGTYSVILPGGPPPTDGCFVTGLFDQWPTDTITPSCIGMPEVLSAECWAGEFSKVQVTAGTEYIFSSSVATDFITIADEDEEITFATGTGSVTWTSPVDQVIRFYTHLDEDCGIEEVSRSRIVQCGDVPPAPANDDCGDITPATLVNGTPVTFTGTTFGGTASAEETSVLGFAAVWEAVTLTGDCNNLTVDYCGTPAGNMDNTFIVYANGCPVSDYVIGTYDFTTCGDGNATIWYTDLPAGTYYLPVIVDPGSNTLGEYTMNVLSEDCLQPPGNGCFVTGQFDQWPTTTFIPSCSGAPEVINTVCWAGEYSKVQVTAGTEYIFSSSVTTDFITIADEDEDIAFATGTGSVTWTSPVDQVIRFYTHLDEDCGIEEVSRSRIVQCGDILPPPANDDCENAIALSCGDSDSGNTTFATDSGGNAAGDVFYTFTGDGTPQLVTVSLCGSAYDTYLRVFSDCTLTEQLAFNDDSCGVQSQLQFVSDGTSTYVIMVEGFSSNVGAYTINVSCAEVPPPGEGCLNASYGQYPTTTYIPSCVGAPETITAAAYAGEYSMVQVTAGTEYIFSSSIATDFITIGNEMGDTVLVYGEGSLTWTSDADQLVRFYTHVNDACLESTDLRARMVQCGEPPVEPDYGCDQTYDVGQFYLASSVSADLGYTVTNDFFVPMEAEQYGINTVTLLLLPFAGSDADFATFDVYILSDNGGVPGDQVIQPFLGLTATNVELYPELFAGYNTYMVTLDLGGYVLPVDSGADTRYWLAVNAYSATGTNIFWVEYPYTEGWNTHSAYQSSDGGSTWEQVTYDGVGDHYEGYWSIEADCELGVSDMNSFNFTYYPNPVRDYLTIDAKKAIETISVHNLAGQSVLQGVKAVDGKVNMSSLSPGVYVFRVTLEGGQVETFKVIKK